MLIWRVLLVLMAMMMAGQVGAWMLTGGLSMLQWLLLSVGVIMFPPALGYAYHYPLVPRWYGVACAAVLFVTFQFSLTMAIMVYLKAPSVEGLTPLAVHLVVVLLLLYPVWQYAFSSPQFWQRPKGSQSMVF
ncbi:hypothetical protein [Ferrimonas marina]|uniref:Uncharacterized protein n=1 Tax=Ferrimonas marina TaxID=299255 RepID=A0A1M5YW01_9GAMM|nr:hypothetical protein [Ferrimonas marina]SHI15713.1 hypothetical protein SAMN02745129_4476 [Ferrimonas marina]